MAAKDPQPLRRKIDRQGRVRIPPEVMAALGVKEEEDVAFLVVDGKVEVRAVEWRVR